MGELKSIIIEKTLTGLLSDQPVVRISHAQPVQEIRLRDSGWKGNGQESELLMMGEGLFIS